MDSKIIATFAAMIRLRKLLFRFILFLIVLFSIGINTYTVLIIQPHSTEIFTGTKNVEDSFSSDIDFFTFDQIDQSFGFGISEESQSQIGVLENCSLIRNFSFTVWQPPKIL